MKKYSINLTACLLTVGAMALTTSCSDEAVVDKWTKSYVSLQATDYLRGDHDYFLNHTAETGVTGEEVVLTFTAKLQKPATADVVVDFELVSPEIEKKQFDLSATQVTIKRGELASEAVTLSLPDFTFLKTAREKHAYKFEVAVTGINTKDSNVSLSTLQNNIKAAIHKSAMLNFKAAMPENSVTYDDKSKWSVAVEDGTRGGDPSRLIDGNRGTDIARDGGMFWMELNLGQKLTLTGLRIDHWSASYSATGYEILTSEDGRRWNSQGELKLPHVSSLYLTFNEPVTTRFVKYRMLSIYNRTVSVRELSVFVPKDVQEQN